MVRAFIQRLPDTQSFFLRTADRPDWPVDQRNSRTALVRGWVCLYARGGGCAFARPGSRSPDVNEKAKLLAAHLHDQVPTRSRAQSWILMSPSLSPWLRLADLPCAAAHAQPAQLLELPVPRATCHRAACRTRRPTRPCPTPARSPRELNTEPLVVQSRAWQTIRQEPFPKAFPWGKRSSQLSTQTSEHAARNVLPTRFKITIGNRSDEVDDVVALLACFVRVFWAALILRTVVTTCAARGAAGVDAGEAEPVLRDTREGREERFIFQQGREPGRAESRPSSALPAPNAPALPKRQAAQKQAQNQPHGRSPLRW
jgi:hypothetical protein